MTDTYSLPSFIADHGVASDTYLRWLNRKAQSLVRRDRSRGFQGISVTLYRREIHAAVLRNGGVDAYTGEQLRWDLISRYDNKESQERGSEVIREFAMLPTVDHVARDDGSHLFEICAWRTNDSKTHMTYPQLVEFASKIVRSSTSRSFLTPEYRLPESLNDLLPASPRNLEVDSPKDDQAISHKALHIGTCRPEIFKVFPAFEFECLDAFGDLWESQQQSYDGIREQRVSDRFEGITNAVAIETEGLGSHISRSSFVLLDLPIEQGLERLYGSDSSVVEFIAKKVVAHKRLVLFWADITERTLDFYYDWLKDSHALNLVGQAIFRAEPKVD